MENKNNQRSYLIPEPIICAAVNGDERAINAVLKHYARYINRLATRQLRDAAGNVDFIVDPYLRLVLETQLIIAMLNFKVR